MGIACPTAGAGENLFPYVKRDRGGISIGSQSNKTSFEKGKMHGSKGSVETALVGAISGLRTAEEVDVACS
jgi:hypothetical protein